MQIKKAIKKGFTLVELVVVIAVIAILAATSVGVYFGMLESANRSADEAAVTQMNKILLLEDTLGDVDSIFDVHEALERNGLYPDDYTALSKGHKFYYDRNEKKILLVNGEGEVVYPEDQTDKDHSDCQWYSLNLSIGTEKIIEEAGEYKVTKAEQFAYVMNEIDKNRSEPVTISLQDDINFNGASISVANLSCDFTLNGNGHTISNLAGNEAYNDGLSSTYNVESKYNAAGFFGTNEKVGTKERFDIIFNNVILDNIHIKSDGGIEGPTKAASNASFIVGQFSGASFIANKVTVQNSSIEAGRNVATFIGNLSEGNTCSVSLTDIKVNSVDVNVHHGRSSLLIGMVEATGSDFAKFEMKSVNIDSASKVNKVGDFETTTTKPYDGTNYYGSSYTEAYFIKYETSAYPVLESALVTYRATKSSKNTELAAVIDSADRTSLR